MLEPITVMYDNGGTHKVWEIPAAAAIGGAALTGLALSYLFRPGVGTVGGAALIGLGLYLARNQ